MIYNFEVSEYSAIFDENRENEYKINVPEVGINIFYIPSSTTEEILDTFLIGYESGNPQSAQYWQLTDVAYIMSSIILTDNDFDIFYNIRVYMEKLLKGEANDLIFETNLGRNVEIDTIGDKIRIQLSFDKSNNGASKQYNTHAYNEVMRDRNGLEGDTWTFYAEVLQYQESNGKAVALVFKDGNYKELVYLLFNDLPKNRLVEDDRIDVYGDLLGLHDYETVRGDTNTVPKVRVDKVLVEGIDY